MAPRNHHHVLIRLLDNRSPSDKKDWIVPVLVAVISGFFAITSVVAQILIQNESQKHITRLIEQEKTLGQQSAQAKFFLSGNLLGLLTDIDRGFEQLCNFSSGKKSVTQKSFISSLAKYREQLDKSTPLLSKEALQDLEAYSEFIVDRQYEILYSPVKSTGEQRKLFYQESQELRRKAQRAIANL